MKRIILLAFVTLIITTSCNKGEHYPSDISEFTSKKIETSDKVMRVDESWKLRSSNYELSDGIYRYTYSGGQPDIEAGSVIVDTINGGYIRKVDEVILNNNGVLKLGTSQATFSDLFDEGTLEFVIGLDENLKSSSEKEKIKYEDIDKNLDPGFETADGTEYEINAKISDAVSIEGSMTFKPRIYFKWEFSKEKGLEKMDFFLDNTQVILDATFEVSNNQSVSASVQKSFGKLTKRGWFWVSGIPVIFDIEVELIGYGIIEIEEQTSFPVSFTNTSTLSFGVSYSDGEPNFVNAFTNKSEINANPSIEANAQIQVNIVPQINIKFYEVLGTVIKPKPYIDVTANYINVAGTSEICAQVDAGIDLGLSLRGEIFDEELFDVSKDFEGMRKTLWKSDDDCILPEVSISEPEWSIGTHTCSTTPYTVTFQVEDPAGIVTEGTSLNAMHMFHYNTGETKSGSITRNWDEMEYTPGQLSYNICIGWVDASYVEQSFYITTPDGTKSNMVTVIIPRGSN